MDGGLGAFLKRLGQRRQFPLELLDHFQVRAGTALVLIRPGLHDSIGSRGLRNGLEDLLHLLVLRFKLFLHELDLLVEELVGLARACTCVPPWQLAPLIVTGLVPVQLGLGRPFAGAAIASADTLLGPDPIILSQLSTARATTPISGAVLAHCGTSANAVMTPEGINRGLPP